MAFNPFAERGIPIEKQWDPIKRIVQDPYDKERVDELSRLRVIDTYGMENEQWYFYHQLARHTDNDEIREAVALIRRTEDQHRSEASFLFDPTTTILELTIAYEHLAVAITAAAAKDEPDPYIRQVFDYGLLEDYDHLFRFSILLDRLERLDANSITRRLVEIKPGRPTWEEHLHPRDTLRNFFDARKADPLTRLHALSILAPEQQTRQYYASEGYWLKDQAARQLYAEIGQIEEQHVSQYESIIDPRSSWLEMAIDHEYNEIYTYHGFLQTERDPKMKGVWEDHLAEELEHLRIWNELYNKYEGKDGRQLWPEQLPKPIALEPAQQINDYVKQVLANQVNLRAAGKNFVPKDRLPADWPSGPYRQNIDAGNSPSTNYQPPQGPVGGVRL
ncbi:MAG: hypothetical protein HYY30_05265 [Chloroflexi bacterium]|nr:hypothetical protein [Chloroflexota bacterium]